MRTPLLLRAMRPAQWTKNLLVFAALLFHLPADTIAMCIQAILSCLLFCAVSGCVYIWNDTIDLPNDRDNPEKQDRPIAAGQLSPVIAIPFSIGLYVLCLIAAYALQPSLVIIVVSYALVNLLYSFYSKHVAIADLFSIAAGFVLRALAGGVAIGVPLTSWFLLCAMLLSLFLATGKRRYEVLRAETLGAMHRVVLLEYSTPLLDQLNGVTAALVIMAYAMFTFTSRHNRLMITIPFVIYGIFRYFQLIHVGGKGGRPERILLHDRHILVTVLLYAVSVMLILMKF